MKAEEARLVYFPDPRLRQVAKPIQEVTQDVHALVPRMFEVMRHARGIGLAGPQIGYGFRLVVASVVYDPEKEAEDEVYVNPEIVARAGKVKEEEGCLSLPGLYAAIERSEEVTVEYATLEGENKKVTINGLHARLFQHEVDHLDGVLIVDKMSAAEKKHWAPYLKDLEEQFESGQVREAPASPSSTAL